MKIDKILKASRLMPILALFLLLSACETPEQQGQETPAVSPDSPAQGQAPAGTEVNPVAVRLSEYEITMPETLPAGPTAFEVTNVGDVIHNFEVEGQGMEQEFEQNLQPGETETLQVDLQPGTYRVYCPVANHADQGMSRSLTVTGG